MANPKIAETFALFDRDGSGSISMDELRDVITMLGVSENKFETDSMLTSLDLNGDGTVRCAHAPRPTPHAPCPIPHARPPPARRTSPPLSQVDLWEFCVYIQKQREQVAQATDDWAISQAFELFQTDSDGCINVEVCNGPRHMHVQRTSTCTWTCTCACAHARRARA